MPHVARKREAHAVVLAPPAMGHAIPALELVERLSSRLRVTLMIPGPFLDTLLKRGILQEEGGRAPKGAAGGSGAVNFDPGRVRLVRIEGLPPFPVGPYDGLGMVITSLRAYRPALEKCFREASEQFGWAAEAPASEPDVDARAKAAGWWPEPPTALAADFLCVDPLIRAARAVPVLKELPTFTLFPGNRRAIFDLFKEHPDELDEEELPEVPDDGPVSKDQWRREFIDGTNLLKPGGHPKLFKLLFSMASRGIKRSSGCLVDTFEELEQAADADRPSSCPSFPMHSVGPLCAWSMREEGQPLIAGSAEYQAIVSWLDAQPPRSVIYVAFGSVFTLEEDQIRQLETAMFCSGHPFLWSLRLESQQPLLSPETLSNRRSPDVSSIKVPGTAGKSPALFVDWCPQRAVLAHPAVGGFVSHCGWNSSIESVAAGVPVIAWPLGAEQHVNAQFLVDRKLAVPMRQTQVFGRTVPAGEIASAVRELFEGRPEGAGSKTRGDVARDFAEKARRAVGPGGSSWANLEKFPFY